MFFICHCCPHRSVRKRFSIFATAAVAAETYFLKSHVGQSAIVLEYSVYPGSDALTVTISFSETRINHKAPDHSSKKGGESEPRVSVQKLARWQSSVRLRIVTVNQSVLVSLSFGTSWADLLSSSSKTCWLLCWLTVWPGGTNFWWIVPSHRERKREREREKSSSECSWYSPWFASLLSVPEMTGFCTARTAFCFWVLAINLGVFSCFSLAGFSSLKS